MQPRITRVCARGPDASTEPPPSFRPSLPTGSASDRFRTSGRGPRPARPASSPASAGDSRSDSRPRPCRPASRRARRVGPPVSCRAHRRGSDDDAAGAPCPAFARSRTSARAALQLREPRARSPRDNCLVDSRSVLLAPVATQYPAGRQLPVLDAAVRQRPSDASVPEFSVPGMDAATSERDGRPVAGRGDLHRGRPVHVLAPARPAHLPRPEAGPPRHAPTARERRPRPEARGVVGAIAVGAS
jgi:hypothetical protein